MVLLQVLSYQIPESAQNVDIAWNCDNDPDFLRNSDLRGGYMASFDGDFRLAKDNHTAPSNE
jgi:hypothetical protein